MSNLQEMKNIKYIRPICDILFLLFSLILLLPRGYVWKWVESLSLFIPDESYLQKFLSMPGGILAYLGCFLTQSLYYPVVGSLIFILLLFVVQHLTFRVFRFRGESYPLSFVPSLMLLTAVVNMGYTWITIKAQGHFFAPTLGCIIILLCAYTYINIRNYWIKVASVLVFTATYPLFGFYSLCAAGLSILLEWRQKTNLWKSIILFVVGVAAIWIAPKLCYYNLDFTQQEVSRMYLGGMPDFFVRRSELMLWVPFLILTACLALFAIIPYTKRAIIPMTIYVLALIFTATQVYRNKNFEASVRENAAIDSGRWNEVLNIYRNSGDAPTRDVVLNGELAAAMIGAPSAPHDLPDIPYFYKDSRPGFLTFLQLAGFNNLYYQGQSNLCYRWNMEMSVEYGWRVANLKQMVKCCLLQGEYELAGKYNGILLRTAFHKDWARRYQRFIDEPSMIDKDREFAGIRDAAKNVPDTFID